MFQVRQMRAADFAFATRLANTMGWDMAEEDFQFLVSLEPEGCFVAYEDSKRLGIATSISYGKVGWFGNLIVTENSRKMGVGSHLVEQAIKYLHGKGVKTIGLYAYPNLVGFYGKLGFKYDEDFLVLHAKTLCSITAEAFPRVTAQQIGAVAKFDSCCFGGDRKRLLENIILEEGNLSYCALDGDQVVGYVAATVYNQLKMAWLGPSVCESTRAGLAFSLIKAALEKLAGFDVHMVLPKKETALTDALFKVGFKEDFNVSRMFLGSEVAQNCVYVAESLERG
jgi:predicted N-acetyltransferase YhbS